MPDRYVVTECGLIYWDMYNIEGKNPDERSKTTILLSKLLIDSFWIECLQSQNNAQPYIEDYNMEGEPGVAWMLFLQVN